MLIKFITGLALIAALSLTTFRAAVASPLPPLKAIKISSNAYYFQGAAGTASKQNHGFMSNAGFVVTPAGVVVFDALATPSLGTEMLKAIRAVTEKPIHTIIVSHYHADHFYGLQTLAANGAAIWAHHHGRMTLESDFTQARLEERRVTLKPWVDRQTKLVPATRWLDFRAQKAIDFELGGVRFSVIDAGGAHSPEDLMLFVEGDQVLFAGDLFFTGRLPFVGNADSKAWLRTFQLIDAMRPLIVVPGHGSVSTDPSSDSQLTRNYLLFLREQMGKAVADMIDFDTAYQSTDWSAFSSYPAFAEANRLNAYGTYLLMERESLAKP